MNFLFILLIIMSLNCDYSKVHIKEHSTLIKLITHKTKNKAVTIGNTIYLSCSKETFLRDTAWVKHEMNHVKQYKKLGVPKFLVKYMALLLTCGYDNHPMEKECYQK